MCQRGSTKEHRVCPQWDHQPGMRNPAKHGGCLEEVKNGDVPKIQVSHLCSFAHMKFDAAHIMYIYIYFPQGTDTEALPSPTSAPSSVPFCISPLSLSPRACSLQPCHLLLPSTIPLLLHILAPHYYFCFH